MKVEFHGYDQKLIGKDQKHRIQDKSPTKTLETLGIDVKIATRDIPDNNKNLQLYVH